MLEFMVVKVTYLKVKIFNSRSYGDLENIINAFLANTNNYTSIISTQFWSRTMINAEHDPFMQYCALYYSVTV